MTSIPSRGLVVAVVGLLACSVALGAVTPAVAGDGYVGEDPGGADLGLDETVGGTVDVAGDLIEDDANASRNSSDLANGTANATTNGTVNGTSADAAGDGSGGDETTPEPTSTRESTPAEAPADGTNDSSAVADAGETVEAVGDGVSKTVNRTGSGAGSTVNETVNATGTGVDETDDTTGSAVNETVNATGETVADTVDGADENVEGTTNVTTGGVEGATDDVTDTAGNTTDGPTDTVGDAAAATTDETTSVTSTIDQAVTEVTGSAGNATADADLRTVVDRTTTVVRETTDAVTAVVGGTVEESGDLLEDAASGSIWHSGDDGSAEATGHPPANGGSSAAGPGGSWSGVGTDASTLGRAAPGEREGTGDADGAGSDGASADGDGSSGGGVDPAAGGAAVGAALLIGSLVATRSGMTASSMGAGAAALPRTLFALLREFAFRLAVLAGYSRYDFDDPLENENRAAVLTTVESSPGINTASLVEATGLSESTVRYHLRVLEHEDLLEAAKVRGRRRYVPHTDDDVEFLAAFEEESTKAVLAALFEHEPATGTALAEALDRDTSTVSHHLSRLADAGLVDREQDGPALRNSLTPKVRRAFAEVETTPGRRGYVTADD